MGHVSVGHRWERVAMAIFLICRFGILAVIHSDQSSVGDVPVCIIRLVKIERFNRTLLMMLAMFTGELERSLVGSDDGLSLQRTRINWLQPLLLDVP